VYAVSDVNMTIERNEMVAVVGESGCGKSTLALSIIGLLPIPPAEVVGGQIWYKEVNLLQLKLSELLTYRGTEIAMIFQEPMSSLNPVYKVGEQIAEAIAIREERKGAVLPEKVYRYDKPILTERPADKLMGRLLRRGSLAKRYEKEVQDMLKLVRIPDPEQIAQRYPFELSGGMRQRVMIAMALAQRPSLLIADEPTTALDVTIQAQILRLMKKLMEEVGTSILLITHDLAVAAEVADRINVMYAGQLIEEADVLDLFSNPLHPYTKGLLGCIPSGFKEDGELRGISGDPPDLRTPPKGCMFAPRCAYVRETCWNRLPHVPVSSTHRVRCVLYE